MCKKDQIIITHEDIAEWSKAEADTERNYGGLGVLW